MGGVSRFYVENLLSHSAEKFRVGISFSVELFSGTEKFWRRGGGGYQDFTSKIYCLTVPKSFVWESFTVELFWGTKKNWRRGGYQDFTSKSF